MGGQQDRQDPVLGTCRCRSIQVNPLQLSGDQALIGVQPAVPNHEVLVAPDVESIN